MTGQQRFVLFASLLLFLQWSPGCVELPTTGMTVAGAPDGVVEVMVVSATGQIELREDEFLRVIDRKNRKLVVIDLWAPWCGPCRQLTPILETIKQEWGDKLEVVKVNIDDNRAIAAHLDVEAIPSVRIFSDGTQVGDFLGLLPKDEIETLLRSLR